MEFCDQSWNFTNFAPKFDKICRFFVNAKKLSSNLESLYFLLFSTKCHKCKIGKRDGHGKSRNGHGKIFCQVCGNPVIFNIIRIRNRKQYDDTQFNSPLTSVPVGFRRCGRWRHVTSRRTCMRSSTGLSPTPSTNRATTCTTRPTPRSTSVPSSTCPSTSPVSQQLEINIRNTEGPV